jgi:hypothetical protein
MAFITDDRKTMLDQHLTTTRILNEVRSMADELLLPDIPIAQRREELNELFSTVANDSKLVMSFIVFLFRIKVGGSAGPPTQEAYEDICKKIGMLFDKHPQELLQTFGEFGRAMNEIDKQTAGGGKPPRINVGSTISARQPSKNIQRITEHDNGQYLTCNQCGRRSAIAKPGEKCKAQQPDGHKCRGRFTTKRGK